MLFGLSHVPELSLKNPDFRRVGFSVEVGESSIFAGAQGRAELDHCGLHAVLTLAIRT